MSVPRLRSRLAELELSVKELKVSGECLQGVRLEKSRPGGTASINSKANQQYARLRAGKGKVLSNGKKSRYVPKGQISEVEAAIARGKQLTKLEKEIAEVRSQLQKVTEKVNALVEAGFTFGQLIRFVGEVQGVELEMDGVMLSAKGESLTLGYRAFMPGGGEQTGVMEVVIDELQLC